MWPEYFTSYIQTASGISQALSCLASTVNVYDGDYWSHAMIERGEVKDIFASMPHYFAESTEEAERLASKWQGQPEVVAKAAGIDLNTISPYLVHLPTDGTPLDRKALADDEFPLDDIWVFTDFWQRIGIQYPDSTDNFAARVHLNRRFDRKLPPSVGYEL